MSDSDIIIGIDLGTCNSSAAIIRDGRLQLIKFSGSSRAEGQYVLPSYVEYDQGGNLSHVGAVARNNSPLNPKRTFYNVKRIIGKKYEDALNEAKLLNLAYDIVRGDDGYVKLKVDDRTLYPHQVTAEILKQIKKDAEANLNREVKRAVVTVPAYFNDEGKKYTRMAGQYAGLEVVHLLVEPAAALLTYSEMAGKEKMYPYLFSLGPEFKPRLDGDTAGSELIEAFKNNKLALTDSAKISRDGNGRWMINDEKMIYTVKEEAGALKVYKSNPTIMVFDIGAGTLDIVIMSYMSVRGDEISLEEGQGTRVYDTQAYDQDEQEQAAEPQTEFEPLVYEGDSSLGGANMDAEVMGYVLREINDTYHKDLSGEVKALGLKEMVEEAKIRLSRVKNTIIQLDYQQDTFEVPMTQEKLEQLISPEIEKCRETIRRALEQLKTKGIGKEEIDDVILVGGPTRMPAIRKLIEDEIGKPLRKLADANRWDPMTCVAAGAAHWVDLFYKSAAQDEDMGPCSPVPEGTPYAYGIFEIAGRSYRFIKLIEKCTVYPTKGDYSIRLPELADRVKITVGQVNPVMLEDSINLGEYEFRVAPLSRPREIDVAFELDHDGILSVTMKDLEEGEGLTLKGIVGGEGGSTIRRPIAAVMSVDEKIARDIEEQRAREEEQERRQTDFINKLSMEDRAKMIENSMMTEAYQKILTAYKFARKILTFKIEIGDMKRIMAKMEKLDELVKNRDKLNPQDYYSTACDLSEDLIRDCEETDLTIPEAVLNESIVNANNLINSIRSGPGIPADIGTKVAELEEVVRDAKLSDNKRYIRIEGRLEEIKHLQGVHKVKTT